MSLVSSSSWSYWYSDITIGASATVVVILAPASNRPAIMLAECL